MNARTKNLARAALLVIAAAIAPALAPPALGSASRGGDAYVEEIVEVWIKSFLVPTGEWGRSWLHLVFNWPEFVYFEFLDLRQCAGDPKACKPIRVYTNELLTVQFADGSSVQLRFLGPFAPSGLFWQIEHGSERGPGGREVSDVGPHGGEHRGRGDHYVASGATPLPARPVVYDPFDIRDPVGGGRVGW